MTPHGWVVLVNGPADPQGLRSDGDLGNYKPFKVSHHLEELEHTLKTRFPHISRCMASQASSNLRRKYTWSISSDDCRRFPIQFRKRSCACRYAQERQVRSRKGAATGEKMCYVIGLGRMHLHASGTSSQLSHLDVPKPRVCPCQG